MLGMFTLYSCLIKTGIKKVYGIGFFTIYFLRRFGKFYHFLQKYFVSQKPSYRFSKKRLYIERPPLFLCASPGLFCFTPLSTAFEEIWGKFCLIFKFFISFSQKLIFVI